MNSKTKKNNKTMPNKNNKPIFTEKDLHYSEVSNDKLTASKNSINGKFTGIFNKIKQPAFIVFLCLTLLSLYVGQAIPPQYAVQKLSIDAQKNEKGDYFYTVKGKPVIISNLVPIAESTLLNAEKRLAEQAPSTEFIIETQATSQEERIYQLKRTKHWGIWSLLPAVVAIALCWLTREPVTSLFSGILSGALILKSYDLVDVVLLESMASKSAAGIIILYLWLLGGLMGIWAKTGAARAFATLMTKHIVKGPKSAKFVAWMLGIIFFQGGTMSTVLVGTTVKPIADKEKISHEELSYIVDSTASPIACILAFNAWPGYVQAFLLISGVGFLATETDRIQFFFSSIPFSFYAIFSVLFTLLLCFDKAPFLSKQMKTAIKRARETGQLDAETAQPMSAKELERSDVPRSYTPHIIDFFLPLSLLIGITIATFVFMGSPKVRWGFGAAFICAAALALFRGMKLTDVMSGVSNGLKGVVLGSVILVLAITIGAIAKQTGGGIYLVELLGSSIPYLVLPALLMVLTVVIAFSTGTSWGTYAVAFPLAMPLAWSVALNSDLSNPKLYLMICFATVLNGSVMGDQCSPISDTTILSSMCTGCDLMDHVKTQIYPSLFAAGLSIVAWTAAVLILA
jgi:Na+/H+ antiporter NhaC